jgi:putative ABC transport system permease protein
LIALLGGILGIGMAYLIDIIIEFFIPVHPSISGYAIVVSAGICVMLGVIFGALPSIKGAKINPVDALRHLR